mmetsp:Transcript_29979/g.70665  ORF Transcript_29979/g.70665 Transcript_29979/m.70665 type:complete len:302 (-) Transcript_29979:234-1139(-)
MGPQALDRGTRRAGGLDLSRHGSVLRQQLFARHPSERDHGTGTDPGPPRRDDGGGFRRQPGPLRGTLCEIPRTKSRKGRRPRVQDPVGTKWRHRLSVHCGGRLSNLLRRDRPPGIQCRLRPSQERLAGAAAGGIGRGCVCGCGCFGFREYCHCQCHCQCHYQCHCQCGGSRQAHAVQPLFVQRCPRGPGIRAGSGHPRRQDGTQARGRRVLPRPVAGRARPRNGIPGPAGHPEPVETNGSPQRDESGGRGIVHAVPVRTGRGGVKRRHEGVGVGVGLLVSPLVCRSMDRWRVLYPRMGCET